MSGPSRRTLLASLTAAMGGLAGCSTFGLIESTPAEAPNAVTPEPETDSNNGGQTTEETQAPGTELQQLGLRAEKVSDDPPDSNLQTWRLKNVGDKRILATNAVEVWDENSPLQVSAFDTAQRRQWQYGIGLGSDIQFTGFAKQPLSGVAYTAEDIPISPPSGADVTVSPTDWTTPSDGSDFGSSLIFEFENPTTISLEDVKEIGPRLVTHQGGETLKWTHPDGPYWTNTLEVTVSTVQESASFTIGVSQVPQYSMEITELTESKRLTFEVTAGNELGVWNARALVFEWPSADATTDASLSAVTKVQQSPTGPDERQGALVVREVGQSRIGKTASYTIDVGGEVSFPVEDSQAIGVLILVAQTPVAYTSATLASLFS